MSEIASSSAFMARIITHRDAQVNTHRAGAASHSVKNGRMPSFGARIRALRKNAGLSQEALAHACGYAGQSRIANYEKDTRTPSIAEIETLARALGVTPSDLVGTSDQHAPASVARTATRAGYVRYQLMDAQGGAGPGVLNSDFPEVLREVEVAEWQLRQEIGHVPLPSRVKLLTVRGESMLPRIRNGDVVFVDVEDQQIQDGGLFVIALHGFTLVKRLEVRTDGLHIVSLAAPDRPDVVPPDKMDSLHIRGRVLGAIQLRRAEDL